MWEGLKSSLTLKCRNDFWVLKSGKNGLNPVTSSPNNEVQVIFAINEAEAMLVDSGYRKPMTKLIVTDAKDLKLALINQQCMLKVKAYTDQFIEGHEVLGIMNVIRKYPDIMKEFFVFNPEKSVMTPG